MLLRLHARRRTRGFTLAELLIVVAIIGLLAGIALPNFRNSRKRAQESVLKQDLWILRSTIDQYYTDKGKYPESLEALVDDGYIRKVPVDPLTGSSDTWEVETDPLSEDAPEEESDAEPGITNVISGAPGIALDGTEYSTW